MKKINVPWWQIHKGSLILVNEKYSYFQDDNNELIAVDGSMLERRTATLLSKIMDEFDGWKYITVVSGWRSENEQEKIYRDSILTNGRKFTEKYVARPGHSEHQTGLAVDLGIRGMKNDFIRPYFADEGAAHIFRDKAARFGFIERYPEGKETITKIAHEPWHFRYVGSPHASIMSEKHLTLEEYTEFVRKKGKFTHFVCDREVIVSYIPAENGKPICVEIESNCPYVISGNNVDGLVMTQWRAV